MPRIPRFQRSETLPGSAGGVFEEPSVRAGRAVEGFGLQLVDTAEGIGREQERLENEERHYSTLRLGNQINEEALIWEQERLADSGVFSFHSMEKIDEWGEETRRKYLTDLNDARMRRPIEGHIASTELKLRRSLSRHEAGEREKVGADTRLRAFEGAEKAARSLSGTLEENLQVYNQVIASDPQMSPLDKEDALREGQSAIAIARLEGLVALAPAEAIALVKSGDLNEYLDDTTQAKARRAARAAVKALEDSRRQQEKGLRQRQKEELERAREATGNLFTLLMVGVDETTLFPIAGEQHLVEPGDVLTSTMIIQSNLHPTEGQNSKRAWLKLVEEGEKAAESPEAGKTDPVIDAELTAEILDDPNKEGLRDKIRDSTNRGISGATARTLITFMRTQQRLLDEDPLRPKQSKFAKDRLNKAFKDGLFGEEHHAGGEKWAEQMGLLQRYIVNHEEEPDFDPQLFVNSLLAEPVRTWGEATLDKFKPGAPGMEAAEARRKAALEAAAGPGGEEPPEAGLDGKRKADAAKAAQIRELEAEITEIKENRGTRTQAFSPQREIRERQIEIERLREALTTDAARAPPSGAAWGGINPKTGQMEYFDAQGNSL